MPDRPCEVVVAMFSYGPLTCDAQPSKPVLLSGHFHWICLEHQHLLNLDGYLRVQIRPNT